VSHAAGYAPGRVEVLGNHTDYNQGVVLAAAIDRGLRVTGIARSDEIIRVTSTLMDATIQAPLKDLRPRSDEQWVNYTLGVVQQFAEAGYRIGGFEAEVSGDLPAAAGLSSSAAFEVATAGFLMALHEFRIDPLTIAKLCQRAENEFVGVASGLLDQIASIFGRADHLVYLDCKTEEIRAIRFPADLALIVAQSGVPRDLLQSQYNARREECAAAAKALGVASLRDLASEQFCRSRLRLSPTLGRRAAHIVEENERVREAVEALQMGDATTLGVLMNASHESSRTNFENSTPELDLLVSIAQSIPGVLGSRLTGGGFGGSTVTLVGRSHAVEIAEQLRTEYAERSGHVSTAFICRVADGAAISWRM
jgi:galactokinase